MAARQGAKGKDVEEPADAMAAAEKLAGKGMAFVKAKETASRSGEEGLQEIVRLRGQRRRHHTIRKGGKIYIIWIKTCCPFAFRLTRDVTCLRCGPHTSMLRHLF
jgi:hypothetical protein